ncbi:MAG: biotin/lipoyl-containing protein, partial [Parvibaculum sp.]|nr:biotin/lipoyl-containing protein [Parvibaculum sp.]
APTRALALSRLQHFLTGMEVVGPKTNLAFLTNVLGHAAFQAADIDTSFIDKHLSDLVPSSALTPDVLGAALIGHVLSRSAKTATSDPWSPWAVSDSWVLGGHRSELFKFIFDGEALVISATCRGNEAQFEFGGATHVVSGTLDDDGGLSAVVDGKRFTAAYVATDGGFTLVHMGVNHIFVVPDPLDVDVASDADTGSLKSPMPGKIVQVLAKAGASVAKGTPLIVMEAMKMEQTLAAPADAVIASVNVAAGDQVEAGAALVVFEQKADG